MRNVATFLGFLALSSQNCASLLHRKLTFSLQSTVLQFNNLEFDPQFEASPSNS